MTSGFAEVVAAACVVGGAFCSGGLYGLYLAWSQPERMRAWAGRVERAQKVLTDAEERKGIV